MSSPPWREILPRDHNGWKIVAGVDWKDEQFRLETGEVIACRGARNGDPSLRMKAKDEREAGTMAEGT
jgi:hypothetical protein